MAQVLEGAAASFNSGEEKNWSIEQSATEDNRDLQPGWLMRVANDELSKGG